MRTGASTYTEPSCSSCWQCHNALPYAHNLCSQTNSVKDNTSITQQQSLTTRAHTVQHLGGYHVCVMLHTCSPACIIVDHHRRITI
jgi:hypothetical protein